MPISPQDLALYGKVPNPIRNIGKVADEVRKTEGEGAVSTYRLDEDLTDQSRYSKADVGQIAQDWKRQIGKIFLNGVPLAEIIRLEKIKAVQQRLIQNGSDQSERRQALKSLFSLYTSLSGKQLAEDLNTGFAEFVDYYLKNITLFNGVLDYDKSNKELQALRDEIEAGVQFFDKLQNPNEFWQNIIREHLLKDVASEEERNALMSCLEQYAHQGGMFYGPVRAIAETFINSASFVGERFDQNPKNLEKSTFELKVKDGKLTIREISQIEKFNYIDDDGINDAYPDSVPGRNLFEYQIVHTASYNPNVPDKFDLQVSNEDSRIYVYDAQAWQDRLDKLPEVEKINKLHILLEDYAENYLRNGHDPGTANRILNEFPQIEEFKPVERAVARSGWSIFNSPSGPDHSRFDSLFKVLNRISIKTAENTIVNLDDYARKGVEPLTRALNLIYQSNGKQNVERYLKPYNPEKLSIDILLKKETIAKFYPAIIKKITDAQRQVSPPPPPLPPRPVSPSSPISPVINGVAEDKEKVTPEERYQENREFFNKIKNSTSEFITIARMQLEILENDDSTDKAVKDNNNSAIKALTDSIKTAGKISEACEFFLNNNYQTSAAKIALGVPVFYESMAAMQMNLMALISNETNKGLAENLNKYLSNYKKILRETVAKKRTENFAENFEEDFANHSLPQQNPVLSAIVEVLPPTIPIRDLNAIAKKLARQFDREEITLDKGLVGVLVKPETYAPGEIRQVAKDLMRHQGRTYFNGRLLKDIIDEVRMNYFKNVLNNLLQDGESKAENEGRISVFQDFYNLYNTLTGKPTIPIDFSNSLEKTIQEMAQFYRDNTKIFEKIFLETNNSELKGLLRKLQDGNYINPANPNSEVMTRTIFNDYLLNHLAAEQKQAVLAGLEKYDHQGGYKFAANTVIAETLVRLNKILGTTNEPSHEFTEYTTFQYNSVAGGIQVLESTPVTGIGHKDTGDFVENVTMDPQIKAAIPGANPVEFETVHSITYDLQAQEKFQLVTKSANARVNDTNTWNVILKQVDQLERFNLMHQELLNYAEEYLQRGHDKDIAQVILQTWPEIKEYNPIPAASSTFGFWGGAVENREQDRILMMLGKIERGFKGVGKITQTLADNIELNLNNYLADETKFKNAMQLLVHMGEKEKVIEILQPYNKAGYSTEALLQVDAFKKLYPAVKQDLFVAAAPNPNQRL